MAETANIHHVSIGVSDLDRSVGFYRDVLGFREVLRAPFNDDGHRHYLRLPPDTSGEAVALRRSGPPAAGITLVRLTGTMPQREPLAATDLGAFLIAFELTPEAFDQALAALADFGGRPTTEPTVTPVGDLGHIRAVVVADPDGFLIELYHATEGPA